MARRRLNPMGAAVLANIALGAGKYYVRKYGTKAALAAGTAYAGYKGIKYATSSKPKVTRETVVAPKRTKVVVQPIRKKIVRKKISPSYTKSNMGRRRAPGKMIRQQADGQRKEYSFKNGKKLTSSALVDKTVKAAIQRQLFFWRRYDVEGAGNAFALGLDNAIGGTTRFLPIYMFDLTARPQVVLGTQQDAIFAYRLATDTTGTADGKVRWVNVAGKTAANVDSTAVQPYETSNLANDRFSAPISLLNWVDIRAQFQGPRAVPGKITVQLIKLLDEDIDPNPSNGLVGNSGATNIKHQVFWQSEIASCTVSPVHIYTRPKQKYIKVLASKTFETQPRESVDKDARGQMTVLKWFNRLNKIINYNNRGSQVSNDNDLVDGRLPTGTNLSGIGISPYADSKDKIFLYVKAYQPITSGDPEFASSFELNCRMCHSAMV